MDDTKRDAHPDDGTTFVVIGERPGFQGKQTFDTQEEAQKVFDFMSGQMTPGSALTMYRKEITILGRAAGPHPDAS